MTRQRLEQIRHFVKVLKIRPTMRHAHELIAEVDRLAEHLLALKERAALLGVPIPPDSPDEVGA